MLRTSVWINCTNAKMCFNVHIGAILAEQRVLLGELCHGRPTSQKRSHYYGLSVTTNKRGSRSFTIHPHTNHTWFTPQPQDVTALWLVLIAPTHEGMARLSWPDWLVTYRDKCHALGIEPLQSRLSIPVLMYDADDDENDDALLSPRP